MAQAAAFDYGRAAFRRQVDQDLAEVLAGPIAWHNLAGKTVLISGGTGFIGSYLVETILAAAGDKDRAARKVIVHVRSREKAERRFAHLCGRPVLEFVTGDIAQPIEIDAKIDLILHAASPASPRHYLTDPVGVLRANLAGTERLLERARRDAARLLFFSSGEVYGQTDQVPTPEDGYGYLDPTLVRACYGEGKRAGETLCVAWASQFDVHVSIVRPFHTYGPGIALDDGRVFADFVADLIASRDIVMHSAGSATRAFCYIADALAAFFTVLFAGQKAMAYNVGNPQAEISVAGLGELLVGMYPEYGLKVVRDDERRDPAYAPSPIVRNVPSIERIARLGWSPKIGLEDGFRRMIDSYR